MVRGGKGLVGQGVLQGGDSVASAAQVHAKDLHLPLRRHMTAGSMYRVSQREENIPHVQHTQTFEHTLRLVLWVDTNVIKPPHVRERVLASPS